MKKPQLDEKLYLRAMNENQGQKKADKEKYYNDLYKRMVLMATTMLLFFTWYLCFQWFSKHFFIIAHEYLFFAKHYNYCSSRLGK